jgi:hypothetical protein
LKQKSLSNDLKPSKIADHKYHLEGDEEKALHRTACTPGTRTRILEEITQWAKGGAPDSPDLYWLFGPAGSGKSTIACTIARRFDSRGDGDGTVILGGNFFCSRQFEETRQSKRIIRTIAYHLALRSKPFADALSRIESFEIIDHNIQSQIRHLLVEPWQAAVTTQYGDSTSPPKYLVVIDALDEIDGGGSESLRTLFGVLSEGKLLGLKFFATSRLNPDLVTAVDSFERRKFYRLQDVGKEEVWGDIEAYLTIELPHLAKGGEMSQIVSFSDGLFIFAATIVRYLEGVEPSEQKELLAELLAAPDTSIPKRSEDDSPLLDELYRQIVKDSLRNVHARFYPRRLRILHTFLCTTEPTSELVIANLLSTSHHDHDSYIHSIQPESVRGFLV